MLVDLRCKSQAACHLPGPGRLHEQTFYPVNLAAASGVPHGHKSSSSLLDSEILYRPEAYHDSNTLRISMNVPRINNSFSVSI